MLDKDQLETQLKSSLHEHFKNACEQAVAKLMPVPTKNGDQRIKEFSESFTTIIEENISKCLAGAIDYYVKNIELHGTVITVGSATTQTAKIDCTANPTANFVVPNAVGIK